ncbi:MAG: electron transfer flavoprotein subunit alpha/FixB family protein [Thermoprotei archaeon]|jgi:electron transfer flavoprotein alpha subunit
MVETVIVFGERPSLLVDASGLVAELSRNGFSTNMIGITISDGSVNEAIHYGFDKLYVIEGTVLPDQIYEIISKIFDDVKPRLLIGPATKTSNDVLARVSAKHNLPMLTEVISVSLDGTSIVFERNILGGRAVSREVTLRQVAVTVPIKKFKPFEETQKIAAVEKISPPVSNVKLVSFEEKKKGGVNIEAADIVVGVGRGFRSKDDLKLAFDLATIIDAQVGCSRPIAADLKWLPEDVWIGISSKKIRPKLYIAIGISGAPQHISAVDAKVIVSINKDKNAPIFKYSDYGVVADLYQFLPVFIKKLKEKTSK